MSLTAGRVRNPVYDVELPDVLDMIRDSVVQCFGGMPLKLTLERHNLDCGYSHWEMHFYPLRSQNGVFLMRLNEENTTWNFTVRLFRPTYIEIVATKRVGCLDKGLLVLHLEPKALPKGATFWDKLTHEGGPL